LLLIGYLVDNKHVTLTNLFLLPLSFHLLTGFFHKTSIIWDKSSQFDDWDGAVTNFTAQISNQLERIPAMSMLPEWL